MARLAPDLARPRPPIAFGGVALGLKTAAGGPSAAQQARTVASEFFTALSTRRFDRACALLSADFYRLNGIPD